MYFTSQKCIGLGPHSLKRLAHGLSVLGTPCGSSRARHCKVSFLSQYICGGHSSETGVVLSAETVLEDIFIFPDKDLETACLYQSIFAFDQYVSYLRKRYTLAWAYDLSVSAACIFHEHSLCCWVFE